MKTRLTLLSLVFASLFLGGLSARAESTTTAEPGRELAVVVVENLHRQRGAITDFDRIDMALQKIAKQRNWPVKIAAERFASNTPARDTELRIYPQPLREETSGDLTFRGWVTLTVNGTKHDFGIIKYQYYRRIGEHLDDVLDKVFLGACNVAADKIEPILFPELARSKS